MNPRGKSAFECAHQNLESTIRYLRYDMHVPSETILVMVKGMLGKLATEDAYRLLNEDQKGERT